MNSSFKKLRTLSNYEFGHRRFFQKSTTNLTMSD